jgi:hypothetical protein
VAIATGRQERPVATLPPINVPQREHAVSHVQGLSATFSVSRQGRGRLAGIVGALAIGLVAVGAALPWLTVFAGLTTVPGFLLEGGPLAGIGIGAAVGLLAATRLGGARLIRPLAIGGALFVAGDSLLIARRIADFVADPGPAAPLIQPAAGPGAVVMAAGALLLVIAALAAPLPARSLDRGSTARLVLGTSLFVAGWIHLLLTPEHLAANPLLGAGFLGAGLAQLALAGAAVARPSDRAMYAIVGVNVALVALYACAVVVGLPLGHEHVIGGGVQLGTGEPVDATGALNLLAELLVLALAFGRLGAADTQGRRPGPATVDPAGALGAGV